MLNIANDDLAAHDLTARKYAEAMLRESDELQRQIIASVSEGIIAFDRKLRYTIWNPYMEALQGIKAEDVLGRRLQDVFPAVRSNGRLALFERALTGESVNLPDAQPLVSGGSVAWIQTRAGPLRDARGAIVGVIATLRDVTERKRAEDLLSRSREDLRALAARVESAREEECVRIAREAHDELGQNLTAIKMDLAGLRKALAASKDREFKAPLLEKIDAISKMLSGTVASVRRICTELRPSVLDDIGLTAAIESHTLQFQARSGIRCSLSLCAEPIAADAVRGTVLFRIFQEILTNVARHAHASRVSVALKPLDGNAVLEVHDNGRGFDESAVLERKTLGLLGMRERAFGVGGTVDIQSIPRKGTTVIVRIPIESRI